MKLTAYILIFALFFVSVGTSLFFFPELQHIRTSMQKQLEKQGKNNIEFVFTKEAYGKLDWTRKDKEFRFKSRMYDVSLVKTDGENVQVFCLFDKEETALRQKLKNFFSSSSDKNLPLRQAIKVLSQKYFTANLFSVPGLFNFRILLLKPYLFSIRIFENELTDPPPKV